MANLHRFVPVLRSRFALLAAGALAAQLVIAQPASAQPAATPATASDADVKKALDLFKKGQGLVKANKFAEALPLFRESFALVPSPNSRIYVARCLAGTGDHVGAYAEFEALIADVDARQDDKYKPARDSAAQEQGELLTKIALVTVQVAHAEPATRVSIAGTDIPAERWGKPMPYAPGPVDVTITTPPGTPQSQRVELAAGDKRAIDLDAKPAGSTVEPPPGKSGPLVSSSTRRMLRPASFAAGGVGVAGFAMFAISGGLASATYDSLDQKCTAGSGTRTCPADAQSQIDEGKTQKDLANVGLVIGAVGFAAGVTMFVLSIEPGPSKTEAAKVEAVVGPSYLGLQGTF